MGAPKAGRRCSVTYSTHSDESLGRGTGPEWLEDKVNSSLSFDAAKEVHITVPSYLLSPSIRSLLQRCRKLHFKWLQPDIYDTLDPIPARDPPGLHVFFTPQEHDGTDAA